MHPTHRGCRYYDRSNIIVCVHTAMSTLYCSGPRPIPPISLFLFGNLSSMVPHPNDIWHAMQGMMCFVVLHSNGFICTPNRWNNGLRHHSINVERVSCCRGCNGLVQSSLLPQAELVPNQVHPFFWYCLNNFLYQFSLATYQWGHIALLLLVPLLSMLFSVFITPQKPHDGLLITCWETIILWHVSLPQLRSRVLQSQPPSLVAPLSIGHRDKHDDTSTLALLSLLDVLSMWRLPFTIPRLLSRGRQLQNSGGNTTSSEPWPGLTLCCLNPCD